MFAPTGVPLPALRGKQGARTFYLTLHLNRILNNFFPREFEADPAGTKSQRPYDPRRATEIAEYLVRGRDDYVLGALTYAIDRDPGFQEVEPGSNIGLVTIPLDAKLRSTDGQHRRGGIKEAIEALDELGDDHTALIMYVEPDVQKRRQMFSDMNWHQKPVSKSVNVGFDRRDPFARVTQELVESHPLLAGRTETERPSVSWSSENLFTQGAVYDALSRCVAGVGGRVRNRDRWDDRDDELLDIGREFFDLLVAGRPELRAVADGQLEPVEVRADSILGSSTTLRAIAGAYYLMRREGYASPDLVAGLSRVDFSPKNRSWHRIGFVTPGKSTPNARLQEVKAATEAIAAMIRPDVPAGAPASSDPWDGKYAPLGTWLSTRSEEEVRLSFGRIEEILEMPLPPSARRHAAHWYSYEGSAVARGIIDAGWRAKNVDLEGERVTFYRDAGNVGDDGVATATPDLSDR